MNDPGLTATYVATNEFTVEGDKSGESGFYAGRRVRLDCGVDGIQYADVVSATYDEGDDETTVIITPAVATSNLSTAWWSVVGPGKTGGLPSGRPIVKTDDYTLTVDDLGQDFAMNAATEKIFSLPSVGESEDGAEIGIFRLGSADVHVDAADSDTVGDTTETRATIGSALGNVRLKYFHAVTAWAVISWYGKIEGSTPV